MSVNEISYYVEPADLRAFRRHFYRVSPVARKSRWLAVGFLLVFSGILTAGHDGNLMDRLAFFASRLLSMGIVGGGTYVVFSWLARSFFESRQGGLGEHTIRIDPEAVHETSPTNESRTKWAGIYGVDATPTHVFIFTRPNAAYVIPRRAFHTPEAAEQFHSTAAAYHQVAAIRN